MTTMGTIMQERNKRVDPVELSVVIPLYNEEENIPELYRRVRSSLDSLCISYEVILVNDGSKDGTADMVEELQRKDPRLVAVHLSRNFGHQPAVCAGLDASEGRVVIVMDGDLQDPPEVVDLF